MKMSLTVSTRIISVVFIEKSLVCDAATASFMKSWSGRNLAARERASKQAKEDERTIRRVGGVGRGREGQGMQEIVVL